MKRLKEFVKENKKKLLIAGGAIASGVAVYLTFRYCEKPVRLEELGSDMKRIVSIPGKDIPIPESAKNLGVFEYFEEDKHLRCLFTDTFAWDLGKLGDVLINDLEMNPDLPVAITLEYVNN